MSNASEAKRCPKCGGLIPPEAPQGLCPKCLLAEASMPTETGVPSRSSPPTLEQLAAAFPHLEILEFIGQGGMGYVFKARQTKLDRFVALKILTQALAADPAFAERFTREGRLLARLNHPNIVTVHDFGESNGFYYLLMEFVDGVNLRQAMKAGRFTAAQALAIVPKICEALEYAHNEGILHRDIKPENILLDTKGRVKIADFGIAKLLNESKADAMLTGTGANLGTPHYMAPEQIEKPSTVDHRADIYSLGVVFYEMLTGELPIGHFPRPSEKSSTDPRLDDVVLRTLAKEPSRRTQTAGEVKTQLDTIATTKQTAPTLPPNIPVSAPEKPRTWMKWLGIALLVPGIPLGILGLAFLYLVLNDTHWNPSHSEAVVFFSTWFGALALLIGGLLFIKLARRNPRLNAHPTPGHSNTSLVVAVWILILLIALPVCLSVLTLLYLQIARQSPTSSPSAAPVASDSTNAAPLIAKKPSKPSPFARTITLTDPTNTLNNVQVLARTKLLPGESLMALTQRSNAPLEEYQPTWEMYGISNIFKTTYYLGWSFPDYFSATEVESAVLQLRRNMIKRPLQMNPNEPVLLFSVTNQFADIFNGYAKLIQTTPEVLEPNKKAYALVQPKPNHSVFSDRQLRFWATVPPGYTLRSTARPSTFEITSGSGTNYSSDWMPPAEAFPRRWYSPSRYPIALTPPDKNAPKPEPFKVFLGEPHQVFALTNETRAVYQALLELVGPPEQDKK